ncbi:MAG: hypothetical protein WCB27_11680 [Thermoguttaceae bacterium]
MLTDRCLELGRFTEWLRNTWLTRYETAGRVADRNVCPALSTSSHHIRVLSHFFPPLDRGNSGRGKPTGRTGHLQDEVGGESPHLVAVQRGGTQCETPARLIVLPDAVVMVT